MEALEKVEILEKICEASGEIFRNGRVVKLLKIEIILDFRNN